MKIILAFVSALALSACMGAPAPAATRPPLLVAGVQDVGTIALQRLTITDGQGPAIEAGVWLPADFAPGKTFRLVVISHGTGSDFRGHEGTARALAGAGFVVASLTHTGDNWRDSSQTANVAQRPRQLTRLIDYMLTEWDSRDALAQDGVGAFGFSAGGFTVLAAAGGEPDLTRIVDHCRQNPAFYDCLLIAANASAPAMSAAPVWVHHPRIKAIVVAAPALGFTFTRDGLSGVTQPLQLWSGSGDQILPGPFYAERVKAALPRPPEYHAIDGAGHFDFLPVCSERLAAAAPQICVPTPGFDRGAFQAAFNAEMVRFFRANL